MKTKYYSAKNATHWLDQILCHINKTNGIMREIGVVATTFWNRTADWKVKNNYEDLLRTELNSRSRGLLIIYNVNHK